MSAAARTGSRLGQASPHFEHRLLIASALATIKKLDALAFSFFFNGRHLSPSRGLLCTSLAPGAPFGVPGTPVDILQLLGFSLPTSALASNQLDIRHFMLSDCHFVGSLLSVNVGMNSRRL